MSATDHNGAASSRKLLEGIDAALARGALDEAIQLGETLVELQPRNVIGRVRLVSALLQRGEFGRAHWHALAAAELKPEKPELVLSLARQLIRFLENDALISCLRNLGFRRAATAQVLAEAGVLLSNIGAHDEAVAMLDLALQRDPRHAPSRYFRGNLHMFAGELAQAERSLELSLSADPRFAQASWVLSSLYPQTTERNHVSRIQEQLRQAQPGLGAEIYLNFALFNELHDLERYPEAWSALERGCAAKRRRIHYDHADTMGVFPRLMAQCDADFVAARPIESAKLTPIFIVGMHRTGTTLLERVLAGHPDVADGGESYAFNVDMKLQADYGFPGMLDAELIRRAAAIDFRRVGERFTARCIRRANGRQWFTEKLPSNFLNVGYIAKALPHAKFLHLVRDPRETCFSNLRTLFSEACGYSYQQGELADYYLGYRKLMEHWHRVLPGRILDVDFVRLTNDTEAVAKEVFDYCGLSFVAEALNTEKTRGVVATASSAQVRRKISAHTVPAWSHYRQQLEPLLSRLALLGNSQSDRGS